MEKPSGGSNLRTSRLKAKHRILKPESLHLARTASGDLRLSIDGDDRSYLWVKVAHAFPLSAPTKYIGLLDCFGQSIGMIEDLYCLEPKTRQMLQEELVRNRPLLRNLRVTRLYREPR